MSDGNAARDASTQDSPLPTLHLSVMKTTPVTPPDLAASVIAVPPLARHRDLTISNADNRALIQYLEEGGVRTLLYGGNANLYNVRASELPELLDRLEAEAGDDPWVSASPG